MGKILIVDDEQQICEVFKRALTNAGHEVIVSHEGFTAQQMFMEQNPDIVILDIIMPVQEGIETIIKMKAVDNNVKIIAVSGGGIGNANNYLNNALKLGASAAFEKPVSLDELLKKVNLLC